MATYLLTWVQEKWSWDNFDSDFSKFEKEGRLSTRWSCGVTKKIVKGDRAFLIKLGKDPRGILASGWTTSGSDAGEHWDKEKAAQGNDALYVEVNFDTLVRPDDCFPLARLTGGLYSEMFWTPQASGVTIRDDIADKLETTGLDSSIETELNVKTFFPTRLKLTKSILRGQY